MRDGFFPWKKNKYPMSMWLDRAEKYYLASVCRVACRFCLFVWPIDNGSVWLPDSPSVCLSVCSTDILSAYLTGCLCTCLTSCLSVWQQDGKKKKKKGSILSAYLTTWQAICLPACLPDNHTDLLCACHRISTFGWLTVFCLYKQAVCLYPTQSIYFWW